MKLSYVKLPNHEIIVTLKLSYHEIILSMKFQHKIILPEIILREAPLYMHLSLCYRYFFERADLNKF